MRPVWLLVLGACGRLGFDPSGDAASANDAEDAAIDAPTACTGPFGAPQNLTELNGPADDFGAFITDDKLELYFGSDRLVPGASDIYVARRAVPSGPFGPPERLDVLAATGDDDDPYVEPDGLTMWFDTNGEIATSERPSRAAPWAPPNIAPSVSTTSSDISPALSPDGLFLYVASTPGSEYDLFVSQRALMSDVFPPPTLASAVNTPMFECCPQVSGDGTRLWFTTTGLPPIGDNQIVVVTRDPVTGALSGPPMLDPVFDSAFDDVDMFGTRDGTLLGFASNRPGGSGNYDLYLLERSCP